MNNALSQNLVSSPKTKMVIAKGDSATTQNYWRDEDKHCLTLLKQAPSCDVILPNASNIKPSLQGISPLSKKLSLKARKATVLPELKSSSLISLG